MLSRERAATALLRFRLSTTTNTSVSEQLRMDGCLCSGRILLSHRNVQIFLFLKAPLLVALISPVSGFADSFCSRS